ncbi:MAG: RIP metalloprotease RseP [Bacillales bacterium]
MNRLLSILLFLLAFSFLIAIHELGHFIAAKKFGVYCSDFSIGFGPKIFKFKRKAPDAETTFSIGLLPLGGYVGMLSEGSELENVDKKLDLKGRSVEEKKYYQKIIIMGAGIFNNFVLAFFLFLISAGCFKQKQIINLSLMSSYNQEISSKSFFLDKEMNNILKFNEVEIKDNSIYSGTIFKNQYFDQNNKKIISLNNPKYPITIEENSKKYSLIFDNSLFYLNKPDLSNYLRLVESFEKEVDGITHYFPKIVSNNFVYYDILEKNKFPSSIANNLINISAIQYAKSNKTEQDVFLKLSVNKLGQLNPLGVGTYIYEYYNGLNSFKVAAKRFNNSSSAIFKAVISLFYDKNTWGQVGGPLAIFRQTDMILANYPFYMYLNTWALISVNLGIFNLLPFPGLDGWQILTSTIEKIVNSFKNIKRKKNKKNKYKDNNDNIKNLDNIEIGVKDKKEEENIEWKINPKVKLIVSYIGISILILLMILFFIKDLL